MTNAAQQDSTEEMFALQATGTDGAGALRQTVAERIALHRSRRAVEARQDADTAAQRRAEVRDAARDGISRVRDAVTARYQNSPSYREYLASEAERVLQQAQAEAEIAARKARAVADVQMQLLQELEQWNHPEPGPREEAFEQARTETRGELAHALADIALGARELMRESGPVPQAPAPVLSIFEVTPEVSPGASPDRPLTEISAGGLTVKLYDGLETAKPSPAELKPNRQRAAERSYAAPHELHDLDEEIELRHTADLLPAHTLETTPIPANLIEFPRQLIAPRKARPRMAEGPLRDEAPLEPQLRIFEVEPEQIAVAPASVEPTGAPGWQDLLLESTAVATHAPPAEAQAQFTLQPQVAPLGKRLFATGVDAACLLAATAGFLAVAARLGGEGFRHAPKPLLGVAAAVTLIVAYTIYQLLFFSLSESTPGMRAARIALCTFGDDNPSRKAMRRRVLATLLAACPLGVGLLWSFLDNEQLGWHDRMSRMYQRAY